MSYVGSGEIALCDKGTLSTTKTNKIGMGVKDGDAKLTVSPFKEGKSNRDLYLPNKENHRLEVGTRQATMRLLNLMIGWLNLNVDLQFQTVKQSTSAASEDVFQYVSNYLLGLEFEYGINVDKVFLKAIFERAFEIATSNAIIDAADSAEAVDMGFTTPEDKDPALYRAPFFLAIEAPHASALIERPYLKSRNFSIKCIGNRSDEDNILWVYYLQHLYEFVTEQAAIANIITLKTKTLFPKFLFKETTDSENGYYDAFDYNEGILSMKVEPTIGDERLVKVTIGGNVPLLDHTFEFGDGKGGAVGDTTGITGGTMKIGY